MKQQIRYRGLSLAKDEQIVQNGELSLCANVELHDGALRPSVLSGSTIADRLADADDNDCRLLYVHVTTAYTHIIAYCDVTMRLCWFEKDGKLGGTIDHDFNDGVTSIDSIGNTLVVLDKDGIHYILYKNTANTYKYIGQKPPFLSIQFTLSTNYSADYETGGISVDGSAEGFDAAFQQTTVSCNDAFSPSTKSTAYNKGETQLKVKTEKQADITENVWALVNRTNSQIAKAGHFYANFYIRYCYRLYDGSMVMHSAPIFMPVLVPDNYLVYVCNAHMDDDHTVGLDDNIKIHRKDTTGKDYSFSISKLTFMYYPRNVSVKYTWRNDNATAEALRDWSDIVSSIDVFITPPVTRTDPAQTIKTCVYQPDNWGLNAKNVLGLYNTWENVWYYNNNTDRECKTTVAFPGLSNQGYADKIANQSAFYRVCSFKTDDIGDTGEEHVLPVDQSVVENVSTREQMRDDYKSHNFLYPNGCYVYNHRLNLYGLYERLFAGFSLGQMFPYGLFTKVSSETSCMVKKIVVRLNTDNGYKYVETASSMLEGIQGYMLFNFPLFYPDARADRMYVNYFTYDTAAPPTATEHWAEFKLTACNELNGSMHVGAFTTNYPTTSAPSYNVDDVVTMYNRIYTSEQNNPFYFPVEAINSVGTGDIIGLAATTRALSQGQFGQYPLMAFTKDGIWALQVSSTGTYSSIHPISREVCANAESICQLDQSVVFATDRALNKVVESSVASFSDILDGPFFHITSALPKLAEFFKTNADITQLIGFDIPPIDYFKQGRVINDYANNRLLILPVAYSAQQATAKSQASAKAAYASAVQQNKVVTLVYSVRDDAWSTMLIDRPIAVLNSYPYPYLQQKDGKVIALDKKYDYTDATLHDGLIVTRTLTFDQTMLSVTGFDHQTDARNVPLLFLFGSNDNRRWHYIGRKRSMLADYLSSHPYRFFRLAISLSLDASEKYFQTNLDITQKYEKL